MFVDELTISARAGNGGDGVVRWRNEKHVAKGGPAGGDGGAGGSVYMRAVRDLSLLSKYTGAKTFSAKHGEPGSDGKKHGKDGEDRIIDVPVGATVRDTVHGRTFTFSTVGQTEKVLIGGRGGLGNVHFKSSVNRTPLQSTKGTEGEEATFHIELALIVDIGLAGLPNAGKSTLLNTLTNATARIGAYPFTTLEPSLGDLFGFLIADIPGLIEGASEGKGLGHKFLKHIERTKMILHLVSLENASVMEAYTTIRNELTAFSETLAKKEEWIVLTKSDLVQRDTAANARALLEETGHPVFVISADSGEGVKALQDAMVQHLRKGE